MARKKKSKFVLIRGERFGTENPAEAFIVKREFRRMFRERFGPDKWIDLVLAAFDVLLKEEPTQDEAERRVWQFEVAVDFEQAGNFVLTERKGKGDKQSIVLSSAEQSSSDGGQAEAGPDSGNDDSSGFGPPPRGHTWN